MDLPVVVIDFPHWPNPNWNPQDPSSSSYEMKRGLVVEVLTVHFAKRTMRVRLKMPRSWRDAELVTRTYDVSAKPFFEQYNLQKVD